MPREHIQDILIDWGIGKLNMEKNTIGERFNIAEMIELASNSVSQIQHSRERLCIEFLEIKEKKQWAIWYDHQIPERQYRNPDLEE